MTTNNNISKNKPILDDNDDDDDEADELEIEQDLARLRVQAKGTIIISKNSTSSTTEIQEQIKEQIQLQQHQHQQQQHQEQIQQQQEEAKDIPISEIFYQAQKLHNDINNSSLNSNDPQRQAQIKLASQQMLQVYRAVRASNVFSSNEVLDDINTVDLKYILVTFYLGDLSMSVTDMIQRASYIRMAMAYFSAFLSQCQQLKIMHKDDMHTFDRIKEKKNASAAEAREEKIARAKREMAAKKQLQALVQKRELASKRKGKVEDDEDDLDDNELERKTILATIEAAIIQALNHIKYGHDELELLKQMESMKQQSSASSTSSSSTQRNASDNQSNGPVVYRIPGPGMPPQRIDLGRGNSTATTTAATARIPLQASSIDAQILKQVNARQEVFRDRNPFLYTPEEWYDQQVEQGLLPAPISDKQKQKQAREQEAKERDIEQNGDDSEVDKDRVENQDIETMKAREWDNWKDEHEKGAGNKMYRR